MVTQADAIARCRERLGEPRPSMFSDQELCVWLNEGCQNLSRRTESLRETCVIPVVAGTSNYSLNAGTPALTAANIIRIHRVEYRQTGSGTVYPLRPVEVNHADSLGYTAGDDNSGTPYLYFLWGWGPSLATSTTTPSVQLFPNPSSPGTLTVFAYRFSINLDVYGADRLKLLEVPNGWDDLLYDYAEYRARLKDRDPQWQVAKQMFEANLADMFNLTRQYTDAPGDITPVTPGGPFANFGYDWY